MDSSQLKEMKRFRRGFRFVGAMFCLVGSVMLIAFASLLLDPESTIIDNGVRTNAFGPKLSATIFVAMFVLVGLLCLLAPKRIFDRLFVWRQPLLSSWFSK
ncbi:MAG TPA: hypothetical protein PKE27_08120 [Povalibacter sp.]|uniref:hypothetical protein n=1 Tax=Povalibacter sp. TaxID=1962978 RepID=UPI002C60ACD6|nr:hypothetical protein [Povalibacter sp.]HMN44522.1 hypothetical protein [Povalibacter sp.]